MFCRDLTPRLVCVCPSFTGITHPVVGRVPPLVNVSRFSSGGKAGKKEEEMFPTIQKRLDRRFNGLHL